MRRLAAGGALAALASSALAGRAAHAQTPPAPDPAERALVVRPAPNRARALNVYTKAGPAGVARYVDAADLAAAMRGTLSVRGDRARLTLARLTLDLVDGLPFARLAAREVPTAAPSLVRAGRAFVPVQLVADALPAASAELRFDGPSRTLAVVVAPAETTDAAPATVLPSIIRPPQSVTRADERPDSRPPDRAADRRAASEAAAAAPSTDAPVSPDPGASVAGRGVRRRVVVVDAGHGGVDPGMRGAAPGGPVVLEKDVTLGIARAVRAALARRGLDVVLTRDRDTLIALADRGRIANARHGDLFVSVHVNAANPAWRDPAAVRGFETYFLSDARTDEARDVAARENESVRYEGPAVPNASDPLRFIVSDLAQNEYLRGSQRLAQAVQRRLGRVHPALGRGVHQAGFKVLVTASMPAVLVEVGYGSNAADAAYITGAAGQRAIAEAIADAAVEHLERYGGGRTTAERRP